MFEDTKYYTHKIEQVLIDIDYGLLILRQKDLHAEADYYKGEVDFIISHNYVGILDKLCDLEYILDEIEQDNNTNIKDS